MEHSDQRMPVSNRDAQFILQTPSGIVSILTVSCHRSHLHLRFIMIIPDQVSCPPQMWIAVIQRIIEPE